MKNKNTSTQEISGHALSPTAQRLFNMFGTMMLRIGQVSEATGIAEKTLRNKCTTAQIAKGLAPEHLLRLRGIKKGRYRYWHIEIVANWLDDQYSKTLEAINNDSPRKRGRPSNFEQKTRKEAAERTTPPPSTGKPGRRRHFALKKQLEAELQASS